MSRLAQQDAIVSIVWLVANGLLLVCAWRWARRWHPQDGRIPTVLHSLLLAWAVVVVVSFVLSVAGCLTGGLLLGSVAIVAALGLWLQSAPPPLPQRSYPWDWLVAWTILLSLWVSHCVTRGLVAFPSSWDVLDYHLPLVDSWIQEGSLYAPDFSHWSGPGNLEVLGLWFVAPFSGDFWIGMTNLPVTVMLAIATYQLARRIGIEVNVAHITTLVVMCNGIIWAHLFTLDNDVAVAALFTASLAYTLRFAQEGRNADLLYGGIASGLLAGVKYYALGYFAIAWFAAIGFAWSYRRQAICRILVIWMSMGLALGGYWYFRNMGATGNPLYPLHFKDGPVASFGGGWRSTFLGSGRPEVLPLGLLALVNVGGPCMLAAVIAFPLTIFSVLIDWGRKKNEQRMPARLMLAFVAFGTFGVLLITPYAIEATPGLLDQVRWEPRTPVRYGLCWTVLSLCLASLVLNDITLRWSRTRVWICGTVGVLLTAQWGFLVLNPDRGLTNEVSNGLQIDFPGTYLLALSFFGAACIVRIVANFPCVAKRRIHIRAMLGCLSAGILLVLTTERLSQTWHNNFATHYGALFEDSSLDWLRLHVPVGSKVCVMEARLYPFFGPSREFRICRPTTLRSEQELIAFMEEHMIALLVVRSNTNPFPKTRPDFQIAKHSIEIFPKKWKLLHKGRSYSLYLARDAKAIGPLRFHLVN
jgi:hypothetical protein